MSDAEKKDESNKSTSSTLLFISIVFSRTKVCAIFLHLPSSFAISKKQKNGYHKSRVYLNRSGKKRIRIGFPVEKEKKDGQFAFTQVRSMKCSASYQLDMCTTHKLLIAKKGSLSV